MDRVNAMILAALEDAYEDITENIYEYDGTEETLDTYLTDVKMRIDRVFTYLRGEA